MARTLVTMVSFALSENLESLLTLAAKEAGISRSELIRTASRRLAIEVLEGKAEVGEVGGQLERV